MKTLPGYSPVLLISLMGKDCVDIDSAAADEYQIPDFAFGLCDLKTVNLVQFESKKQKTRAFCHHVHD